MRASDFKPNGIYGTDDRKEYFQVTDPVIKQSFRGIVAIFAQKDVTLAKDGIEFPKLTAGVEMNLCPSERFADQPSPASCSGALVAPDLILTAGHCVRGPADCLNAIFALDYRVDEEGKYPASIPGDKAYFCKEIVARQESMYGMDFALVRLNRPVLDRLPLPVETTRPPQVGEKLFVIGHPLGLPAKADTGFVRKASANFVETNLDTFLGNSGSPVFDFVTGDIVGVLYEGDQDFVLNGKCNVSKVCTDDGCMGEDVALASEIFKAIQ